MGLPPLICGPSVHSGNGQNDMKEGSGPGSTARRMAGAFPNAENAKGPVLRGVGGQVLPRDGMPIGMKEVCASLKKTASALCGGCTKHLALRRSSVDADGPLAGGTGNRLPRLPHAAVPYENAGRPPDVDSSRIRRAVSSTANRWSTWWNSYFNRLHRERGGNGAAGAGHPRHAVRFCHRLT